MEYCDQPNCKHFTKCNKALKLRYMLQEKIEPKIKAYKCYEPKEKKNAHI